eukprot:22630-Hanusia_phi.AAC.1
MVSLSFLERSQWSKTCLSTSLSFHLKPLGHCNLSPLPLSPLSLFLPSPSLLPPPSLSLSPLSLFLPSPSLLSPHSSLLSLSSLSPLPSLLSLPPLSSLLSPLSSRSLPSRFFSCEEVVLSMRTELELHTAALEVIGSGDSPDK